MTSEFQELYASQSESGLDPAKANDQTATPAQKRDRKFLDRIQGNILRSHGRGYARHVMIRFKVGSNKKCTSEDAVDALNWIRRFPVTSAREEFDSYCDSEDGFVDTFFKMLGLSKSGYDAIGIPQEHQPPDLEFGNGMTLYGPAVSSGESPSAPGQHHRGIAPLVIQRFQ